MFFLIKFIKATFNSEGSENNSYKKVFDIDWAIETSWQIVSHPERHPINKYNILRLSGFFEFVVEKGCFCYCTLSSLLVGTDIAQIFYEHATLLH